MNLKVHRRVITSRDSRGKKFAILVLKYSDCTEFSKGIAEKMSRQLTLKGK